MQFADLRHFQLMGYFQEFLNVCLLRDAHLHVEQAPHFLHGVLWVMRRRTRVSVVLGVKSYVGFSKLMLVALMIFLRSLNTWRVVIWILPFCSVFLELSGCRSRIWMLIYSIGKKVVSRCLHIHTKYD